MSRHPDDELTYRFCHAGPSRTTALASVVLLRDQLCVPPQQCVGRDQACDLLQAIPAQHSRFRRKTPPLLIGEAQSASTHVLPENAILFFQVIDRILLIPVDPAGDGHDEQLPNVRLHGPDSTRSPCWHSPGHKGLLIREIRSRPSFGTLLPRQLRDWGLELEVAADPSTAVRRLQQAGESNYSFVFAAAESSDSSDSFRLTGEENVRLIMMSSTSELREKAGEAGHATRISVPLRPSELLGALVRHLDKEAMPSAPSKPSSGPNLQETPTPLDLEILLCEDNPVNQLVVTEFLDVLGCKVDAVANGLEALEAIASKSYDLVLMDCHMPKLDGYETTRRIRRAESKRASIDDDHSRLTIVALTADAVEDARQSCLDVGMDDYLSKPFTQTQLNDILSTWSVRER